MGGGRDDLAKLTIFRYWEGCKLVVIAVITKNAADRI